MPKCQFVHSWWFQTTWVIFWLLTAATLLTIGFGHFSGLPDGAVADVTTKILIGCSTAAGFVAKLNILFDEDERKKFKAMFVKKNVKKMDSQDDVCSKTADKHVLGSHPTVRHSHDFVVSGGTEHARVESIDIISLDYVSQQTKVAKEMKDVGSWNDKQVNRNRISLSFFFAMGLVGLIGVIFLIVGLGLGLTYLWQASLLFMAASYTATTTILASGNFKSRDEWKEEMEKPLAEYTKDKEEKEKNKKIKTMEDTVKKMEDEIKRLIKEIPGIELSEPTLHISAEDDQKVERGSHVDVSKLRRLAEDEVDTSTAALAVILCLLTLTLFHMIWKRFQPAREPRYGAY